ncbi:C-type lectin domain family 5 member A-like [Rana temporaria]|uniref:C-type lectin domain family 5 member A-like n=1 Tax=Rana temporaria TaxID=8407 RepID=UPI001AAD376B|nr:C-type lectin domain family 5 member A-like [Rana temporaria]
MVDSVTYADLQFKARTDLQIMRCVIAVLSLLCLLLLIPIGIMVKGQVCPEGWIYLDSACYYFSSEKINHSNSSDDCRSKDSQLAHVDRHTKSLQAVINATSAEFWVRLDKVNGCTNHSIKNESCAKFAQNIKFVPCDLSLRWICQRNSSRPVCRD